MKFGLFGINMGPCSAPACAVRVAQTAEEVGFDSLWAGEHVVLPDPQAPPSPLPPHSPLLDPTVVFAFLAGQTKKIRLGTGIIILPQRNPLVLAKELASLDVVSGGRLIFGIGVGYLKAEFDALGIPFTDKGPRTLDYLKAMQTIWSQSRPAYHGKFVSFSGVQALPRPVQQPSPTIFFGGHTPDAFRRAIRYAHGWYGFALDLEKTKQCLAGLKEALQTCERPKDLGELEVSVTPHAPLDRDTVKRFADLGVHRLIPLPSNASEQLFAADLTEAEALAFVRKVGDTLIGRP
jgi:probable F420-dependent oxidoreductase